MALCPFCGGVIGRDCFNTADCGAISYSNDQNSEQQLNEAQKQVGMLTRKVDLLIDILKAHGIDLSALDAAEAEPPPHVHQPSYVPSDDLPF